MYSKPTKIVVFEQADYQALTHAGPSTREKIAAS
jgi:hypothetical protein